MPFVFSSLGDLSTIDGHINAPAGVSAQYPTLFSGASPAYATRPPWQVAGVDYGVGPPSATVYKDPSTDVTQVNVAGSGVVHSGADKFLRLQSDPAGIVTPNPVILDGFDFGLPSGGWGVYCIGTASAGGNPYGGTIILRNCKFKVAANAIQPVNTQVGSGPLQVSYSDIDGDGAVTLSAVPTLGNTAINYASSYTYCRLRNCGSDALNLSGQAPLVTIKYNLIDKLGYFVGAHSDAVQVIGGSLTKGIFQFNTFYEPGGQDVSGFPGPLNSCIRIGDLGTAGNSANQVDIGWNTCISRGDPAANIMQLTTVNDANTYIYSPFVHDNYIDWTSGGNAIFYPTGGGNNTLNSCYQRNISLLDGSTIPGA